MKSRRQRVGTNSLLLVGAVIVTLLWSWALPAPVTQSAKASTGPSPGTFAGQGFDACAAPAPGLMAAWMTNSPYRAVGIYMGGVNRFCSQPQLTASWVSTQQAGGWHLLPIYLGLQPYCTTSSKAHLFSAATAATSGRTDAADAVVNARTLGLAVGSTIFNDIEAYSTSDSTCRTAVLTYQSAWTSRLHDYGYLSGFYSSLGSGVRDQVAVYGSTAYVRPDYMWFARYDGVASVFDTSTPNVLPDSYWPHRRIKQYRGGHLEIYGGQTLNVDNDMVDVTPVPATAFGDFNGNGWSDLITRRTSTSSLYLYPGNGTGLSGVTRFGGGWNAMSSITRFGDFNRDGYEDLLARESATGALWLYPGNGSGFSTRLKIGVTGWNNMSEITPVGDLDGDGYPDLLAVQTASRALYLYPGRGTSLAPRRLLGGGWNAMSELAGVGDFDHDGHVDMVARTTATGELWLYKGTGTGLAGRSLIGLGWNNMRELVGVGDFDRDGFNDLLAVKSATGELFRWPGQGTSLAPAVRIGAGWTGMQPLL